VEDAKREVEETRRRADTAKQLLEEEAERRAAHDLAAAIIAEEEEERQQELDKKNAEEMREVERVREERERQDTLTPQRDKQQILEKAIDKEGDQLRVDEADELLREAAAKRERERAAAEEALEARRRQQPIRQEEEQRRAEAVCREAAAAALELEQQGLPKAVRAIEAKHGAPVVGADAGKKGVGDALAREPIPVSPSLGETGRHQASPLGGNVPKQQVRCLTVWVNSVLPEERAIGEPSELLSTPMVLTLLVERLSGQVIQGVVRSPASVYEHQKNLALSLAFLSSIGCNKYGTEYQTLSLGGLTAVCDALWEMAEFFVMAPQFAPRAQEESPLAYSEQGWMEGARLWVQQMAKVNVRDFAENFQDGSLLLAIMVAAWPGSQIDLQATVRDNAPEEVLDLALSLAQRRWHVPQLLSLSLVSQGADTACILLYLGLLSRSLPTLTPAPSAPGPSVLAQQSSKGTPGLEGHHDEVASQSHRPPELAPPGLDAEDGRTLEASMQARLKQGEASRLGAVGTQTAPAPTEWGGVRAGQGASGGRSSSDVIATMLEHTQAPRTLQAAEGTASQGQTLGTEAAVAQEAASIAAAWREASHGRGGHGTKARGPKCAGCFQSLLRPRLLRCLHIFCFKCLEGMVAADGAAGGLFVPCPACGMHTPVGRPGEATSLDLMNSDEGVLKVISLVSHRASASSTSSNGVALSAARPSVCDNCLQADAGVWCDACDAALCGECTSQIHGFRSITAARQHKPTRLQPGQRAPPRLPTCQVHPGEKLLFLSISRQQLICRECVLVGGHDKDRYVAVEDAGRQTRVDLADMIAQVEDVQCHVDSALQEAAMRAPTVIDTYRARSQRLSWRADELKGAMEERKRAALLDVAQERDRKTQRLLMQGVEIGRVAVALEHCSLLGELLMKSGNDLQVLRTSQSLERLLRAASALPVDSTPVEGPALFSGHTSEGPYDNMAAAWARAHNKRVAGVNGAGGGVAANDSRASQVMWMYMSTVYDGRVRLRTCLRARAHARVMRAGTRTRIHALYASGMTLDADVSGASCVCVCVCVYVCVCVCVQTPQGQAHTKSVSFERGDGGGVEGHRLKHSMGNGQTAGMHTHAQTHTHTANSLLSLPQPIAARKSSGPNSPGRVPGGVAEGSVRGGQNGFDTSAAGLLHEGASRQVCVCFWGVWGKG